MEMARKALERIKEDMDKSKKRNRHSDMTTKPRKQKKMMKVKYNMEEADRAAEQELEALEEKERADGRFLDSNLREATINTMGLTQQKMKIWKWLEISALRILKELADKAVEEKDRQTEESDIKESLNWISTTTDEDRPEGWKIHLPGVRPQRGPPSQPWPPPASPAPPPSHRQ